MTTPRELLASAVTQAQLSNLYTDIMKIHNVKSYGALGDGATVDTVAIQSAFDACTGSTSRYLFFPTGLYVVSSTLAPSSSLYLIGDNAAFSGSTLAIYQFGRGDAEIGSLTTRVTALETGALTPATLNNIKRIYSMKGMMR